MIARSWSPILIVALAFFATELGLGKPQGQSTPTPVTQPQGQLELPRRVRVSSGVSAGLLLKKVTPEDPEKARKKRIQGTVILSEIINKNGDVTGLSVISGDPMLAKAALAAAKQWKYRPYLLQGQPVEVESQLQMNFTLSGN